MKPATPLPRTPKDGESLNPYWWLGELSHGQRLVARVELTQGPSGDDGRINFAYLCHAANNLPRALALLRELSAKSQALISNHWIEEHGQKDVGEAWAACDAAAAFLRELGETN